MGIETSHFKTEKLSEYASALSNRRKVEPKTSLLPLRNDEDLSFSSKVAVTTKVYQRKQTDLLSLVSPNDIIRKPLKDDYSCKDSTGACTPKQRTSSVHSTSKLKKTKSKIG